MKNNRKCNSMNKAEKLARKSLLKEILIVYLSLLLIFLFLLLAFATQLKLNFFYFLALPWRVFIIPIVIFLLSIIAFWFLRKPDHIKLAYDKVSKEHSKSVAEKLLVPDEYIHIILNNTRNGVYTDFFKDLHGIAKFYAVLGSEDNLISIYARFDEHGNEILLDVISKEEFTTYCDVKEETL